MRTLLIFLLAALGGCGFDLDPDSLVRELRILGARAGDPAPGSVADVPITGSALHLEALVAAPVGPGRRVMMARPLDFYWFVCVLPSTLLVPGNLDPACLKFTPPYDAMDPDPRTGASPALLPLCAGGGPCPDAIDADLGPVQARLAALLPAFIKMYGGGGLPSGPIELALPVVQRVEVPGSSDPLDAETAYFSPRIVYTPPGQTAPPPNHNPVLLPLTWSVRADDPAPQPLSPCPAAGPCQPLGLRRDQDIYFNPAAARGSAETYVPLDQSGRTQATEVLRFAWFATDGQFSDERTGLDHPQTKWTNPGSYAAPAAVKVVDLWLVLQDDRGGADWAHYQMQFTD